MDFISLWERAANSFSHCSRTARTCKTPDIKCHTLPRTNSMMYLPLLLLLTNTERPGEIMPWTFKAPNLIHTFHIPDHAPWWHLPFWLAAPHTTDSPWPHHVPVPLNSSSRATAAKDHQHQAAAAQLSLLSNACPSETWIDYRCSQAPEPNLTCARERDYLSLLSARGMATPARAHCSYWQPSDVSSALTAQHRSGWRTCCTDRSSSREVLRAPTHTESMLRQVSNSTDHTSPTFLTPDTLDSTFLALNYTIQWTWVLETTQFSEPGSLKKWMQCASPPEGSLVVCAKNNLNFCFYGIQGPIPSNYRLCKTLLIFQRAKIIYAVHYQSQMVMFKHKFDELYAA